MLRQQLTMSTGQVRYRTRVAGTNGETIAWLADSTRWDGFKFRPDDIVISTPAKCGTTWTQMICALLIFQTADLPAHLTSLSPWLDMLVHPLSAVREQLDAQRHRRFIKTHTPLDGIPVDDRVTYIAVGRDPRDVAVSLHHHRANVDREVALRLLAPGHAEASARPLDTTLNATMDEREAFLEWVDNDDSPLENPYSLRGLIWHQGRAWARRNDPNVVLVHYSDLSRDLEGEMRRLADRLSVSVALETWKELVAAATFERMRDRSAELVPDERAGLFTDPTKFFRTGTSGGWQSFLTDSDLARYEERLTALAPPELVPWIHHGRTSDRDTCRGSCVGEP
jgi:aryl sulfotransferase